jgi:hypothetical protein
MRYLTPETYDGQLIPMLFGRNIEYELSDGRVLCAHCAQECKRDIVSHRLVTHAPNCDACDFSLSDF